MINLNSANIKFCKNKKFELKMVITFSLTLFFNHVFGQTCYSHHKQQLFFKRTDRQVSVKKNFATRLCSGDENALFRIKMYLKLVR